MKFKNNALVILAWIISLILAINFLVLEKYPNGNPDAETKEETIETIPSASSEMVGNMEFIGCARNAVATSPITFYYYRDIVTDQIFLISSNQNSHTVTPMTHPDTGLPLTYSEYQAMKNSK